MVLFAGDPFTTAVISADLLFVSVPSAPINDNPPNVSPFCICPDSPTEFPLVFPKNTNGAAVLASLLTNDSEEVFVDVPSI